MNRSGIVRFRASFIVIEASNKANIGNCILKLRKRKKICVIGKLPKHVLYKRANSAVCQCIILNSANEQIIAKMETNCFFRVSDDKKVSVEAGKYGKFVRITNKTRWIALTSIIWQAMLMKCKEITRALKEADETYKLELNEKKSVNISKFKDNCYVCFKQENFYDDKDYSTYINLTQEEWQLFLEKVPEVDKWLELTCVVKFKKANRWNFFREAAVDTEQSGELEYGLFKALSLQDISVLTYAYAIAAKIMQSLAGACTACANNVDAGDILHTAAGTGCQQTWEEAVNRNIDEVALKIDITEDCRKVTNAVGWRLPEVHFNDDSRKTILNRAVELFECDDENGQLAPYRNLFAYLKLGQSNNTNNVRKRKRLSDISF